MDEPPGNTNIEQASQPSMHTPHPARSLLSIGILLVLVFAVTAQLITGFFLMTQPSPALLVAHIIGGIVALVFTVAEWIWLGATPAGRHRLTSFVAAGSGLAEWSEAVFLVAVSFTVLLGILLAAIMNLGLPLNFVAMLKIHRALAFVVAALYLIHTPLSMYRTRRRKTATSP